MLQSQTIPNSQWLKATKFYFLLLLCVHWGWTAASAPCHHIIFTLEPSHYLECCWLHGREKRAWRVLSFCNFLVTTSYMAHSTYVGEVGWWAGNAVVMRVVPFYHSPQNGENWNVWWKAFRNIRVGGAYHFQNRRCIVCISYKKNDTKFFWPSSKWRIWKLCRPTIWTL